MRLWDDMPTDPIWRVIAKRSGQRIGDVIAMFNILMVQAGANADERGRTQGNDDDEIGAALDISPEDVQSIREGMQGKVLDGVHLTGWEKRQPKREDNSAERARKWRERNRTQPNAEKRPDADADADAEGDTPNPFAGANWDAWIAMRKKMRKSPTEHAVELSIKKLAKLKAEGHDPNDVLDQSTMNNYTGLFPVKREHLNGTGTSNGANRSHRRADDIDDAARNLGFGGGFLDP